MGKGKGGFLTSTVEGEPPGEDVNEFENWWHPLSGHSAGRGIFALLWCVLLCCLCRCYMCVVVLDLACSCPCCSCFIMVICAC